MKQKKKSRVFWLNLIVLFISIIEIVDATTLNVFNLSAHTTQIILTIQSTVITIANIILRLYFTNAPITKVAQNKLEKNEQV